MIHNSKSLSFTSLSRARRGHALSPTMNSAATVPITASPTTVAKSPEARGYAPGRPWTPTLSVLISSKLRQLRTRCCAERGRHSTEMKCTAQTAAFA